MTTEGLAYMLKDFEMNGPSDLNPQLILNPSRGNINIDHPFIRQLYSIPKLRFKSIIELREAEEFERMQTSQNNNDHLILNNLENVANNLIKSEIPNFFVHNERVNKIALAFKDIEENYSIPFSALDNVIIKDPREHNLAYDVPGAGSIQQLYIHDLNTREYTKSNPLFGEIQKNDEYTKTSEDDRLVNVDVDSSVKVKIDFVKLDSVEKQFKVIQGNYMIYIKINLLNPYVSSIFKEVDGEITGVDTPTGKVLLTDIVSEVLAWLFIEEQSKQNGEREYSILDGIIYGKDLYQNKRYDIKLELSHAYNN